MSTTGEFQTIEPIYLVARCGTGLYRSPDSLSASHVRDIAPGERYLADAMSKDRRGRPFWYRLANGDGYVMAYSHVLEPVRKVPTLDWPQRELAHKLARLRRRLQNAGTWDPAAEALMYDVARALELSPWQCAYAAGDAEGMWSAIAEECARDTGCV